MLCAFAPKQTMHNIQIRQTMRNTCHVQTNASFFLCRNTKNAENDFLNRRFFTPNAVSVCLHLFFSAFCPLAGTALLC